MARIQVGLTVGCASLADSRASRLPGQVFACNLTAGPTLQEPIFLVDITSPQDASGGIYNCMNQRRGVVIHEEQREGTNLVHMKVRVSACGQNGCQWSAIHPMIS